MQDSATSGTGATAQARFGLPAAALAVLCCALWGGNALAVKFTVEAIPPMGCAGLRFLASLAVIALWCRVEGTSLRLSRAQLSPVLINALLLYLQIGTFNWGTLYTHAGRSSVFINIHPFVVAPLARIYLGESIGYRGALGLILAGGGVAMLFQRPMYGAGASLVGDLAVLTSGSLLGVITIYQKKLLVNMRPNHLLFWQGAFALPLFFATSAWQEGFGTYRFSWEAIAGLAYQSTLVSGFCFMAWLAMLRRYPANQLAAFGFLTPFFGIFFANLLRGEPLTVHLLGGCALVGYGLYLVTRPVKKAPSVS